MSQPKTQVDLDLLSINTIRTLAIDAVQQANSGHPGAPMGLAPVAYALWQRFLRYDPADPNGIDAEQVQVDLRFRLTHISSPAVGKR